MRTSPALYTILCLTTTFVSSTDDALHSYAHDNTPPYTSISSESFAHPSEAPIEDIVNQDSIDPTESIPSTSNVLPRRNFTSLLIAQRHSLPGIWELANLDKPLMSTTAIHQAVVHPTTILPPVLSDVVDENISNDKPGELRNVLILEPSSSTLIPSTAAIAKEKKKKLRIKRKQTPVVELYSDWTKQQDRIDIYHQLRKLYSILQINEKNDEHKRQRAMWARRYRNRANEEITMDLMSDDAARHKKMIDAISLRKKTAFGEFKIGERKVLARKLNRYWKIDESRAYNRFLRQGKKCPVGIEMAQSNDEEVVRQAAEILMPRTYQWFEAEDQQ